MLDTTTSIVRKEDVHGKLSKWATMANIAKDLPEEELNAIGSMVVEEWQIDVNSRADWKTKTEDSMKLAMQVAKEKQYPWPRASNVIYPLITTAAIQFAARAYPSIVSDRNVARGIVVGHDDGTPEMGPLGPKVDPQTGAVIWRVAPGEKAIRAKNIGDHMSWQLLEEMPEWEPQTDQLLHILPIVGCCFRKTYFDPTKGRNVSLLVSAMNLVVNYWAKSLETAPRATEEVKLYPNEVRENELAGLYIEQNYGPAAPRAGDKEQVAANDSDAPLHFLEQHRWLDLDHDGYKEPYIVTVYDDTKKVVRIVARYDVDSVHIMGTGGVGRIDPIQFYTQYNFLPNPDGGLYGVGLGQLLRPLNESVNTTLNMLIDAGHLSVTSGGFIGRNLSVSAGTMRFSPGEFKTVNAVGSNIKDAVVQLQFPGPSEVLFKLLVLLIDAAREVASVKDVLAGDQQQQNPNATATLALIEQALKVFTGIYKRIYRSLKSELDKLYHLNRNYMDEWAEYQVGDEWMRITRGDYDRGAGVVPVSDPSMVSDAQKAARATLLLNYKDDTRLDGIEILKRAFEAVNIPNIDKLFAKTQMPNPEVILALRDQEITRMRNEASQVLDAAKAVHFLAKAISDTDKATVSNLEMRMDMLRKQLEQHGDEKTNEEGLQGKITPPTPDAHLRPDGKYQTDVQGPAQVPPPQ